MDNTLVFADTFFFITAVAVIFVAAFFVVMMVYAFSILRSVKRFLDLINSEAELVSKDIADVRFAVREEGKKISPFVTFFAKTFERFTASKAKKK